MGKWQRERTKNVEEKKVQTVKWGAGIPEKHEPKETTQGQG